MKKLLTSLLCVMMVVCFMPSMAFAEDTSVAQSADGSFSTLQAAISATSNGGTITLSADINEGTIKFNENKELTLDLAGHDINSSETAILASAGAKVTIIDSTVGADYAYSLENLENNIEAYTGGKIVSSSNIAVVCHGERNSASWNTPINTEVVINGGYLKGQEGAAYAYGNGAKLVINNCYGYAVDNAVIGGNGTCNANQNYGGTRIDINGGAFVGNITTSGYVACGIYHPQMGILNINGGTIKANGGPGVVMRNGELNITGGNIIATGDNTVSGQVGDKVYRLAASAIIVDYTPGYNHNNDGKDSRAVSVTGGDIQSEVQSVKVEQDAGNKTDGVSVAGGTFSSDVKEYLAEGRKEYKYEDTKYVVAASDSEPPNTGSNKIWTYDATNGYYIEGRKPEINISLPNFVVGSKGEFTISTTANSGKDTMVVGNARLTKDGKDAMDKLASCEYYEPKSNEWITLNGNFGPEKGFPLSDATSKFRVEFEEAGTYTITYQVVDANNPAQVIAQNTETFVVSNPYIPPTSSDNVTNSGTTGTDNATTTADINTTASNGTANAVVDQATADKIVDKATGNQSAEVVVDVTTGAGTAENTTVTLPTDAVQKIAEQTEAEVTIKTDAAEVTLDQKAVEAVASKAAGSDVEIVVEKTKDETKEMEFELKIVSDGVVIGEFDGGNVKVTVKLNTALAALKDTALTCVHIDDNGTYTKVGGAKNNDGTYTFTTTHFSSYAIMAEEEADKVIAEQEAEHNAYLKDGVEKTTLKIYSDKGDGFIKIRWVKSKGFKVDGYELYRGKTKSSMKKYDTTKKTSYKNAKYLKKGNRYYYKVRGYRTVGGEKVYTKWSKTIYRIAK